MNHNCDDCSNDSLFVKEVILAYCGVSNTNVDVGTEEPTPPIITPPIITPPVITPPIINTEWVVNRIADGSSCGRFLVQASRTKDSIKVFSDIEVIPTVQQVSDEIMAGNYGTEVNNAVLEIEPKATNWVLDPANNRIEYSVARPAGSWSPEVCTFNLNSSGGGATYNSLGAACADLSWVGGGGQTCKLEGDRIVVVDKDDPERFYGVYGYVECSANPEPEFVKKYLSIDIVAAKVISNAKACNTLSKDRLFNIVMPLAYSGFYNDLFEANILYGEI